MRSVNQITLVGRLGDEPELRTSKTGTAWMRISVATDRRVRDGETWKDATDWHRVTCLASKRNPVRAWATRVCWWALRAA